MTTKTDRQALRNERTTTNIQGDLELIQDGSPRWKEPQPVLDDDALYLGDNGACFCGRHAGMSARYTGRDISGQRVHRVTPQDQAEALSYKMTLRCETPRCGS